MVRKSTGALPHQKGKNMALRKTVYEAPGLKVLEQDSGIHSFAPDDNVALAREASVGLIWSHFRFGDVMSYALKYGDDPINALNRAEKWGNDAYYLLPIGACISDGPRAQKVAIEIKVGDVIRYAGRSFRIEAAANNNLKLERI